MRLTKPSLHMSMPVMSEKQNLPGISVIKLYMPYIVLSKTVL